MNTHTFLTLIQNNYNFSQANNIFSQSDLKNCWKDWLTAELVQSWYISEQFSNIQIDTRYPGVKTHDAVETFLRHQSGQGVDHVSKKSSASRCDFSAHYQDTPYYFEIRCASNSLFKKKGDLEKYKSDIERVDLIKQANPYLNLAAIFVFYGAFSSQELANFTTLDNSEHCLYVLDSNLSGSTSIARLSQMQRGGSPRLCLAVYST